MAYGAKESSASEGIGVALFTAGLAVWVAGWAYGIPAVQVVLDIVALLSIVGGIFVLGKAKAAGS